MGECLASGHFDTSTVGSCYNCKIEQAYSKLLEEKVALLEGQIQTLMSMVLNNDTAYRSIPNTRAESIVDDMSLQSVECPLNEVACNSGSDTQSSTEVLHAPTDVLYENITETENTITSVGKSLSLESNPDSATSGSLSDISVQSISEPEIANLPVLVGEEKAFKNFSVAKLLESTTFTHKFSNREAVYYGVHPYSYGKVTHEPRKLGDNEYMRRICSYLEVLMPSYDFNSVMVQKYVDGNSFMPAHADDEEEIAPSTNIVTVSLGASRRMVFSDMFGKELGHLQLDHGSVISFSKESQLEFKHEIPPSDCKELRISLTFRKIRQLPSNKNHASSTPLSALTSPPTRTDDNVSPKSTTLYISSSMFRHLNATKLSSHEQSAHVLFYPGANAQVMKRKLGNEQLSNLQNVEKIVLMSGTNNIDSIYYGSRNLSDAKKDLDDLISYLLQQFPVAKLFIVNLLPRSSKARNDVIKELNDHLKLYESRNCAVFIDTETEFKLFSIAGQRISRYFMPGNSRNSDNCHLNRAGVTRLAKHLKYVVHH